MLERTGLSGRKYTLVRPVSSLAGLDETLAKLDRLVAQFPRAVPALVRSVTEAAATHARAHAPRMSGSLQAAIRTSYHDDQWTGAVFVEPVAEKNAMRWKASRLDAARKRKPGAFGAQPTRPAKFPVWIEWGTRRMQPRPFLIPAGAWAWQKMRDELPLLIERFVKEAE